VPTPIRSSLLILTVLASAACSTAPGSEPAAAQAPAPAAAAAADEAGAHKAHDAYVAAINSNQLEAFLATVADDVVFIAPNAPPVEGKGAVGEWVKGYLAAYRTEWTKTTREFIVDGDWAYEWYAYRSVDTPRADGPAKGTPVVTDTGNGFNIYRRDAGGTWRVARDIWASDKAKT
jgi:ketosteroid isomerase-like protein